MLATLVFAFARPARAEQVPREEASVVLALDVSRSMQATDVDPTRIRAAKAAAAAFVDSLPRKFRLGLVTFAGDASLRVPPTQSHAAMLRAISRVRLGDRTAIGEAIFSSLAALRDFSTTNELPRARIVLLSDGATTAGRSNDEAAQAAAEDKIPVSTIAFGTPDGTVELGGTVIPVPADRDALREIARTTGGQYFSAASAEELQAVYDDLGSQIGYRTVRHDVTAWVVGFAIVFAFAAATASLLWFSRLP
jgi:Ca-activated chloride channel family protein